MNEKTDSWEEKARQYATEALPVGFSLFDFIVIHGKKGVRLQVFLDKTSSETGSPTIEECEQYAHVYHHMLGMVETMPDQYTVEVSSPGAERQLRLPDDLERFRKRPMKVRYLQDSGKSDTRILSFLERDGDLTRWKTADVKFNRNQGIIGKKKPPQTMELNLASIQQVHLHLDF